jgi:hypothetical protein
MLYDEFDPEPSPVLPREIILLVVLMVAAGLAWLLFTISTAHASPAAVLSSPAATPSAAPAEAQPEAGNPINGKIFGSAALNLNKLTQANGIDETDNARWSLVRGTKAAEGIYSSAHGVDWQALRQLSTSGSFAIPAGKSWSFNAAFGEGPGYKNASGVLAGGQCALATVFRGAATKGGLPNQAKQHRYPIPGFALAETVNIWWGRDDLTIRNDTGQAVSLAWDLTPEKVTVSVVR